jgi:hypothetical protein
MYIVIVIQLQLLSACTKQKNTQLHCYIENVQSALQCFGQMLSDDYIRLPTYVVIFDNVDILIVNNLVVDNFVFVNSDGYFKTSYLHVTFSNRFSFKIFEENSASFRCCVSFSPKGTTNYEPYPADAITHCVTVVTSYIHAYQLCQHYNSEK